MRFLYRMGDIFENVLATNYETEDAEVLISDTLDRFKNTIAEQYILRANHNKDIITLNNIINEFKIKKNCKIPHEDEWVIHIRTGDVIDNTKNSVNRFCDTNLESNGPGLCKRQYIFPLDYYKQKIKTALKYKIKKVTIVSAFHFNGFCENHRGIKSTQYLDRVSELFEEKNFILNKQINKNNPDNDFIYLCNSKYFTNSAGGYSNLAKEIVELNKGTII